MLIFLYIEQKKSLSKKTYLYFAQQQNVYKILHRYCTMYIFFLIEKSTKKTNSALLTEMHFSEMRLSQDEVLGFFGFSI